MKEDKPDPPRRPEILDALAEGWDTPEEDEAWAHLQVDANERKDDQS